MHTSMLDMHISNISCVFVFAFIASYLDTHFSHGDQQLQNYGIYCKWRRTQNVWYIWYTYLYTMYRLYKV